MDQDTRLRVVERRVRTLSVLSAGLACVCAGTIAYTLAPYIGAQTAAPSIRASEVVIVDPKGVERVRIGGQLPDATPGKRRGQDVAGVLLYDATGRERSGYVTFEPSGNVGLTLDGRQGQSAFVLAGPTGGTGLRMWRGNNWSFAPMTGALASAPCGRMSSYFASRLRSNRRSRHTARI